MIEIIQDVAQMRGLATEWNTLAQPFRSPLLNHEWHLACAEAFCGHGSLRLITVRRQGTLVALLPLVAVDRHGSETLEFLGAAELYEACGPIYSDASALEELLGALPDLGLPVLLSRLGRDSGEVAVLRQVARGKAFLLCRAAPGSPWLPLSGSWSAFIAGLSSRARADLRRSMRRAEAHGPVRSELVAPEPAALDAILPELLQVEASGWKGREGTAILADERMKRFFEGYARASAGLGLLRVSRLTVGDVLVAFQLGVEHAGRLWTLKIGHREDWGRCSPGILLTHLTIRESFRRGLEAYEFLGVDQPWIRRWTARMHPYVGVRLYPLAWRSVRDLWRHASGFVSNALGWAMQECQP